MIQTIQTVCENSFDNFICFIFDLSKNLEFFFFDIILENLDQVSQFAISHGTNILHPWSDIMFKVRGHYPISFNVCSTFRLKSINIFISKSTIKFMGVAKTQYPLKWTLSVIRFLLLVVCENQRCSDYIRQGLM